MGAGHCWPSARNDIIFNNLQIQVVFIAGCVCFWLFAGSGSGIRYICTYITETSTETGPQRQRLVHTHRMLQMIDPSPCLYQSQLRYPYKPPDAARATSPITQLGLHPDSINTHTPSSWADNTRRIRHTQAAHSLRDGRRGRGGGGGRVLTQGRTAELED